LFEALKVTGVKFYGKLGGTADRSIRPEIREFYAAKYPKVLFYFKNKKQKIQPPRAYLHRYPYNVAKNAIYTYKILQ